MRAGSERQAVWQLYLAFCESDERHAALAYQRACHLTGLLPARIFWICCAHARELAEHDGFQLNGARRPR